MVCLRLLNWGSVVEQERGVHDSLTLIQILPILSSKYTCSLLILNMSYRSLTLSHLIDSTFVDCSVARNFDSSTLRMSSLYWRPYHLGLMLSVFIVGLCHDRVIVSAKYHPLSRGKLETTCVQMLWWPHRVLVVPLLS